MAADLDLNIGGKIDLVPLAVVVGAAVVVGVVLVAHRNCPLPDPHHHSLFGRHDVPVDPVDWVAVQESYRSQSPVHTIDGGDLPGTRSLYGGTLGTEHTAGAVRRWFG